MCLQLYGTGTQYSCTCTCSCRVSLATILLFIVLLLARVRSYNSSTSLLGLSSLYFSATGTAAGARAALLPWIQDRAPRSLKAIHSVHLQRSGNGSDAGDETHAGPQGTPCCLVCAHDGLGGAGPDPCEDVQRDLSGRTAGL